MRVLLAVVIVLVTGVTLFLRWTAAPSVERLTEAALENLQTNGVGVFPRATPPYGGGKAVVESGVGSVTLSHRLLGHPTQTVSTVVEVSCYSSISRTMATFSINASGSGGGQCAQVPGTIASIEDLTERSVTTIRAEHTYDERDGISVTVTTPDDEGAVIAVRFTVHLNCEAAREAAPRRDLDICSSR